MLGDDRTVCSLAVRFSLPEQVTNADGLQLLLEPDDASTGCALVVQSSDAHGVLQERCRVSLPFAVDETGMEANVRQKLRIMFVTMPVQPSERASNEGGPFQQYQL